MSLVANDAEQSSQLSSRMLLNFQAIRGILLILRDLNDKSTGLSTGFHQQMWKGWQGAEARESAG
jgi:hypothetical protein